MMKENSVARGSKGFTLLELLITIAVIAVLSVVLIIVLNPAETLAKARDSQRISDLNTLKTALGLYITATSTPRLDNTAGNTKCIGGGGTITLFLSSQDAASTTLAVGSFTTSATTTGALSTNIDGTGWVPVNLSSLTGGSPVSQMPIDPTNTAVNGSSTATTYTNSALMYRYACRKSPLTFEIDTSLESATYGPGGAEDRSARDGGNNPRLYEVGTDNTILPATDNF